MDVGLNQEVGGWINEGLCALLGDICRQLRLYALIRSGFSSSECKRTEDSSTEEGREIGASPPSQLRLF